MSLLEINNLSVSFYLGRRRKLRAVNNVSLQVERGESVGLVGESGCGKSTLAATILRLVDAERGRVFYDGADVLALAGRGLFGFRKKMQMVFQDPYGSLNARLSVGSALGECLAVHKIGTRAERPGRVADLLRQVGLEGTHAGRYPHEFSGGQRQRIGIARALAVNPEFIIADEPVSALDVSIQAQILNLLKDLQEQKRFSFLFIAHDLAVVRYMCARLYVMYLGVIMESGATDDVYARPAHPYTQALLDAVPDIDHALEKRLESFIPIENRKLKIENSDEVPSSSSAVSGCPFHPRCPLAKPICREQAPEMKNVGKNHFSRCHCSRELS
jgi:oligopeptide/dipeptide ABC transporter ATP-binding protein